MKKAKRHDDRVVHQGRTTARLSRAEMRALEDALNHAAVRQVFPSRPTLVVNIEDNEEDA